MSPLLAMAQSEIDVAGFAAIDANGPTASAASEGNLMVFAGGLPKSKSLVFPFRFDAIRGFTRRVEIEIEISPVAQWHIDR